MLTARPAAEGPARHSGIPWSPRPPPVGALPLLVLLVLPACVPLIATSTVRDVASAYTHCPADAIEVHLVEGTFFHRHRGSRRWTAKTYRATGCGKATRVDCPEWDSYDQTPVCRASGE